MMKGKLWLLVLSVTIVNFYYTYPSRAAVEHDPLEQNIVKDGSTVTLEYTLSGDDGTVIESSKGKAPLKYIHGRRQIIRGLERELAGMKTGEEKSIKIRPEDGYGAVDPKAFREFPRDKLPPEALQVGTVLTARTPDGQAIPVRVHEVKENVVVLDFNHPLAGKTLNFEVKVGEIQPSDTK
ncbi:MAG TPA: peptidylprolyl isomerase [Candidatus Binatia bacterium]|nr:peptidylprolyl isomerase [Candidatus Binatia bacterium]